MILGHHTIKGKVVYKRIPKRPDIGLVLRFLYTVNNELPATGTLSSQEILNSMAPWKSVMDISSAVRKSQIEWLEYREHPVRDFIDQKMTDNEYYWLKDLFRVCDYLMTNWGGVFTPGSSCTLRWSCCGGW